MDNIKASIFAALWWQSAVSDQAHQITHSHLNNISPEILVPIASLFYLYLYSVLSFFGIFATFWNTFGTIVVIGTTYYRTKCSFLCAQLEHWAVRTLEPVARSTASSSLQPRMEASAYSAVSIM